MGPRLKRSFQYHIPIPSDYDTARLKSAYNDAGQVYTETLRGGGPMTAEWKWRTKGSTRQHGRFTASGLGCSPLLEMATRSCLMNSYDITSEVLKEVPEWIGLQLWERVIAAGLDSVQVFIAFASTYPHVVRHKHYTILKPNMPLEIYLHPVTSLSFIWLTSLTLLAITIPRTALIQLSLLKNLSTLSIGPAVYAPEIGVDDSLIRTWSRAATSTGAFSMLRIFLLRSQPHVTSLALEYLSAFPTLLVVSCDDPQTQKELMRNDARASSSGWRYKSGSGLRLWLSQDERMDHLTKEVAVKAFQKAVHKFAEAELTTEGTNAIDRLPVIDLELGGQSGEMGALMRCWYRDSATRPEVASEVASSQAAKRSIGLEALSCASKKPKMKRSRYQNLDIQLSGIVYQ